MASLRPRPSRVIERRADYALGVIDDLVVIVLFPPSADDPAHLYACVGAIQEESARRGRPVRLLVILHVAPRPPAASVRGAWMELAPRNDALLSKMALVVRGEGFAASIQRAIVASLIAVLRPRVKTAIFRELREGLAHVAEPGQLIEPAVAFCERELGAA
jgi:hypothetical protein